MFSTKFIFARDQFKVNPLQTAFHTVFQRPRLFLDIFPPLSWCLHCSLPARGWRMKECLEDHRQVSMGQAWVTHISPPTRLRPELSQLGPHRYKGSHFLTTTMLCRGKPESLVGSWCLCYTCRHITIQLMSLKRSFWRVPLSNHLPILQSPWIHSEWSPTCHAIYSRTPV